MSPTKGRSMGMAQVTSCALNIHLLDHVLVGKNVTFGMMKKPENSQQGVFVLSFLTKGSVKEVLIAILSTIYRKKGTMAPAGDLSPGKLTLIGL